MDCTDCEAQALRPKNKYPLTRRGMRRLIEEQREEMDRLRETARQTEQIVKQYREQLKAK